MLCIPARKRTVLKPICCQTNRMTTASQSYVRVRDPLRLWCLGYVDSGSTLNHSVALRIMKFR